MQTLLRYITIFLMVLTCAETNTYAQVAALDSLSTVDMDVDTVSISLLLDLAAHSMDFDSKKALNYAKEAYRMSRDINYPEGEAISSMFIGDYHYLSGNFDFALRYYMNSQSILQILREKKNLPLVFIKLGNLYRYQSEYTDAINYYSDALKIYSSQNNKNGLILTYIEIANLLIKQNKLAKASNNLESAKKLLVNSVDTLQLANLYHNYGVLYHKQKDYSLAAEFLSNALNLYEASDNRTGKIITLLQLGELYTDHGKYDEARLILRATYRLAYHSGNDFYLMMQYKQLSRLDSITDNYKAALGNYQKYTYLKDSLFSHQRSMQLVELKEKYESLEKDQLIKNQQELVDTKNYQLNFVIAAFVFILIISIVLYKNNLIRKRNNRQLKLQKTEIEIINQELERQKQNIEKQAAEIQLQNEQLGKASNQIQQQRDNLEYTNKEIEDSLKYAQRIQQVMLPPDEYVRNLLPRHFIFFKPRDIVSGDFYWIKQHEDLLFMAVADCTGHGVPGAFMSMMGIAFLNETLSKMVKNVKESNKPLSEIKANQILEELRIQVKATLRQTGRLRELQDGMDMSLCILNSKTLEVQYAGAYNPVFVIHHAEKFELTNKENSDKVVQETIDSVDEKTGKNTKVQLVQLKADRNPIGVYLRESPFTNLEFKLKTGDTLYMSSDGFMDQAGGSRGRKYKGRNFRQLLAEIHVLSAQKQKEKLENTFQGWMKNPSLENRFKKQLDDVLVVGMQMNFDITDMITRSNIDWSNKTILAAEDEQVNMMIIQELLKPTGCKLIMVGNGQQAVKYVKEQHVDLVVMDIQMPIMNGYEATSEIKRQFDIPVIIATAFNTNGEKEKGFAAGCTDFITKPFKENELISIINRYL